MTSVLSDSPSKGKTLQRGTLRRIKELTLRKITGQRRDDQRKILGTPTDKVRVCSRDGEAYVLEHTCCLASPPAA